MEKDQKLSKPKIGFYLRNRSVAEVDLRHPEKGNPGVGGTQFNFVALPYYLKKYTPECVQSIIYANAPEHLPTQISAEQASSVIKAATRAEKDGCDAIVYRPTSRTHEQELLGVLGDLELKAVAWGHNVPQSLPHMDALASSNSVSRFVVVGRERFDQIRDHPLFEKSRCILNGFDPTPYIPDRLTSEGSPTVAYVGSLTPAKGFHRLAEAWPGIRQRVPDAKLDVIGSGRLYDRDAELGEWEVASESYEKQFRPYLSTEDGEPHPSVDFKGTLGTEKIPLLQSADVGVVNPTGRTENCPGSAIEFQAAGTPVVSISEWGLLDTVRDGKTGILIQNASDLEDTVVRLLRNEDLRLSFAREGIRFVEEKFSFKKVCNKWCEVFERVKENKRPLYEPIQDNLFYRDKWLRELMRYGKRWVPRLRSVAPLFASSKRSLVKQVLTMLIRSE